MELCDSVITPHKSTFFVNCIVSSLSSVNSVTGDYNSLEISMTLLPHCDPGCSYGHCYNMPMVVTIIIATHYAAYSGLDPLLHEWDNYFMCFPHNVYEYIQLFPF